MEQTLGSITHYLNLRREEDAAGAPLPRWLPVEYTPSRMPWTVAGSLRARRELSRVLDEIDGIFVHTTTLAPLAADYFGKRPTVLSSDGTPASKGAMRAAYGLKPQSTLAEVLKRALYRRIFARCRGFVAWSHWTKASFVDDYGCRAEDVAVIPPGIRLDEFAPAAREHELPRILFVGADFQRKGGELLLQVFRQRLRGKATLALVTKAEVLEEPGVQVFRNLTSNSPMLRDLFSSSDIFALPTRADCFPLVCMEACAAGLPLVGTRVGGMADVIREGETGHLIAPDDAGALGDALEALATDRRRREAMGKAARREAEERFDARDNARRLFEFTRSRC
jgi:glycosyltransferase involved in cell wall biosynthesis